MLSTATGALILLGVLCAKGKIKACEYNSIAWIVSATVSAVAIGTALQIAQDMQGLFM